MDQTNEIDGFLDSLLKECRDISKADKEMFQRLTEHIRSALDYTEVSFWTINRNSTPKDGIPGRREEDFISTSLVSRDTNPKCNYKFDKKEDHSHTLKQASLFSKVFQEDDLNKIFKRFNASDALKNGHRSSGFIKTDNIEEVLVIPIREIDSPKKPIAFLELSRTKDQRYLTDEDWGRVAYTCNYSFANLLREYARIRQQKLVDELIQLFNTPDITKDNLYRKLLSKLQIYCPCQGASFFLCDTFPTRYDHKCTIPDIENNPSIEGNYYMLGEGFTGRAAEKGEIFISDNLSKDQDRNHSIKIIEKLPGSSGNSRERAQTGMFIPVCSRTNKKDIVGVIRLVNKKNVHKEEFVDFFNDVDVRIMKYASDYLSPIIDAFVKEKKSSKTLTVISHGLDTYVNEISSIIDIMSQSYGKTSFDLEENITKLSNNVNGLKISLENNLFFANNNVRPEYNVIEYSNLYNVIQECKSKVLCLAKNNSFPLDNITVKGNAEKIWIAISGKIMNLVFFNLFSNAIKYKNDDPEEQNEIKITVRQNNGSSTNKRDAISKNKPSLHILVQDYGTGITKEEKDRIFNPGIRGSNVLNMMGTGMGLYIVRTIVEDWLEGRISVTACKNPTTFKIEIPSEMYFINVN